MILEGKGTKGKNGQGEPTGTLARLARLDRKVLLSSRIIWILLDLGNSVR